MSKTMERTIRLQAIRGIQAGKQYYLATVYFNQIKDLTMDISDLPVLERNQRKITPSRKKAIAKYILQNRETYIFPSITSSIDAQIDFICLDEEDKNNYKLGYVELPYNSLLINDGQHRLSGISEALENDGTLKNETITFQIHEDIGFENSKQFFVDINKNAVKPARSLNILYNTRDIEATTIKDTISKIKPLTGKVEYERPSLSKTTDSIITLNQYFNSCNAVTNKLKLPQKEKFQLIVEYWKELFKVVPEYRTLATGKETPQMNRELSITGHAICYVAIAQATNKFIHLENWKEILGKLKDVDFKRTNPDLEGVALRDGKILGTKACIDTLTKYIIEKMDINSILEAEEQKKIEAEEKEKEAKNEEEKELNIITQNQVIARVIQKEFLIDKKANLAIANKEGKWLKYENAENADFILTINNLTQKENPTMSDVDGMFEDEVIDRLNQLLTESKKTKEEAPKEEAPKEEAPKEEAPKAETPKEETQKEETPKEETPKEETPKEETPKEETKTTTKKINTRKTTAKKGK